MISAAQELTVRGSTRASVGKYLEENVYVRTMVHYFLAAVKRAIPPSGHVGSSHRPLWFDVQVDVW